jgi:hypothetical protein
LDNGELDCATGDEQTLILINDISGSGIQPGARFFAEAQ